MRIGELAERAAVSVRSLRYYEEQGLLDAGRTASGQRIYEDDALDRVRLVQQLYAAGLPSRTILTLLPCVRTGHATPEVFATLRAERDRISERIGELEAARAALDRVIDITEHPTAEHCPTLRGPGAGAAVVSAA